MLAFLAIALGLMITFGGWATATLTGGTPDPVRVVEVQPGQTLYDIAGSVAKPGHIREMVYQIEELNSLPSATIDPGPEARHPRELSHRRSAATDVPTIPFDPGRRRWGRDGVGPTGPAPSACPARTCNAELLTLNK